MGLLHVMESVLGLVFLGPVRERYEGHVWRFSLLARVIEGAQYGSSPASQSHPAQVIQRSRELVDEGQHRDLRAGK